ncbi:MAG: hypothetical protein JY451_02890 [Erythrobacter sp.]|nr:MAG: hypothetical protein JY451_02890 [Erythrobacter sp.]
MTRKFASGAIAATALLAACGEQAPPAPEPQTIVLEDTGPNLPQAELSPDTSRAGWQVAEDGQAIHFAEAGEAPWLTLACELDETPIGFTIIRHAEAFPGESALFPFVGNGMISRFLADATLHRTTEGNEWRWEAHVPAADPQLDIFEGTRDLTATLPGRGMLEIAGSRIPGEFVAWCRAGGRVPTTEPTASVEP